MMRVFVYEYLSAHGPAVLDGLPPEECASLMAQGLAMRDALRADIARLSGAELTYAHGLEAAGSGPGRPVAALAGESPLVFVQRHAAAHDAAWIVAPECSGLLVRLHDAVAAVPAVGRAPWVGCDNAALRLASSKQATVDRLSSRGICTPLAFFDGAASDGRWVVKPDDGAGTVSTRVHRHREAAKADWTRRLREGETATLEPWVEGEVLSLSLLCRPGQVELLAINRQRIHEAPDGLLRYDGVDPAAIALDDARAPALRELSLRVARAVPGLRGYVGLDAIWHPQRGPVLIEINPRLTCAYVGLSAALGRNLAGEILAARADEAREPRHA